MLIAVTILLTIIVLASAYALYRCIKRIEYLVNIIESMNTQVEESLDILNTCYGNIDRATKVDVLSDEPVIKDVLNDIRQSRNAILLVANKISAYAEDSEEITETPNE